VKDNRVSGTDDDREHLHAAENDREWQQWQREYLEARRPGETPEQAFQRRQEALAHQEAIYALSLTELARRADCDREQAERDREQAEHIARIVADAPDFTEAQINKIRLLLHAVPDSQPRQ
jgi:hypothetical protein